MSMVGLIQCDVSPCIVYLYLSLLSQDDARITLRFRSAAHLLRLKNDTRLQNILESISCLVIIADVSTDTDVIELIDIVTKFRVAKKRLILSIPDLNAASLQNKTIHFNVLIHHSGTGSNFDKKFIKSRNVYAIALYLIDGKNAITCLCPVLGKRHAQTYNGLCPHHTQTPYGKELKISFIGVGPYINYDPIGGSEFLIVKILAEKFKFRSKFIPERAYDMVEQKGTFYGMLHSVRFRNEC